MRCREVEGGGRGEASTFLAPRCGLGLASHDAARLRAFLTRCTGVAAPWCPRGVGALPAPRGRRGGLAPAHERRLPPPTDNSRHPLASPHLRWTSATARARRYHHRQTRPGWEEGRQGGEEAARNRWHGSGLLQPVELASFLVFPRPSVPSHATLLVMDDATPRRGILVVCSPLGDSGRTRRSGAAGLRSRGAARL